MLIDALSAVDLDLIQKLENLLDTDIKFLDSTLIKS